MSSNPPSRPDESRFTSGSSANNSKFKIQNSKLCFVCVGAGDGSRFGGDKLAQPLGQLTVLTAALGALRTADPTAPMVIVVAADSLEAWRGRLQADYPEALLLAGGARRQDSVFFGVEAAGEQGAGVVAIHDAARPLVDPSDVREVIRALGDADGAILVERVTGTVKKTTADGTIVETLDRRDLRLAQTPQVFRISSLLAAWRESDAENEWTDESALLESMGLRVRSVIAQRPNPKLTTDFDLRFMRCLDAEDF